MGPRPHALLLLLLLLAACGRELTLADAPTGSPGAIGELRASHLGDEVTLLFTAPSAEGQAATAYELRVGPRERVTPGGEGALELLATPRPEAPGTPERLTFVRPLPDVPAICFVLRARLGASAGPYSAPACLDFAPPAAPTLTAAPVPEGRALRLSYTPPPDADLQALLLVRAPEAPPTVALADGALPEVGAAAGNGLVVAKLPVAAGEHLDTGLQDGARYGYALVAIDLGGNVSAAATATGVPADLSAPPPAPSFTAAGLGEARVRLDWTLPADPTERAPLAVTLVRRVDAPVETGPADGRSYAAGDALGEGEVLYDGPALSFTDAGLPSGAALHYALFVRDAAQNFSSPARADAISVQGPAIEALAIAPAFARRGATVEITFTLGAPPTVDPEVTVGNLYAVLDARPPDGVGSWRFTYRASGDEPEGLGVPVEVRAIDATGTASRRAPVVFDFTAPALVTAGITPAELRPGAVGVLSWSADEPLAPETSVTLEERPLACAPLSADELQRCTVPGPRPQDPDGPASVLVRLVDRAGNEAIAAVPFVRDAHALVDPTRVAREERYGGRAVRFEPGALEPSASVRVTSDEAGAALLGVRVADGQGAAEALELTGDPAALWLHETDRAGNESGPIAVTRRDLRLSLDDPAARLRAHESGSLLPREDELAGAVEVDAASRAAGAATTTSAAVGAGTFEVLLVAPPDVRHAAAARRPGAGANDPERVFFFGGQRPDGSESDELVSWDGLRFQRAVPVGPRPGARARASLAMDEATRTLLLFGGERGGQLLGDLWRFDPATNGWTELTWRGVGPSPRRSAALWVDPEREGGLLLLYGGVGAGGIALGDHWAWAPATGAWRLLPFYLFHGAGSEPPPGGTGVASLFHTTWQTLAVLAPSTPTPDCMVYEYFYSPNWLSFGWNEYDYFRRPASCGDGAAITAGLLRPLYPRFLVSGGVGRESLWNCYDGDGWTGDQGGLPPRRFHALGVHEGLLRQLSLGGEDDAGAPARAFWFEGGNACLERRAIQPEELSFVFPVAGPGQQLARETGGELAVLGPWSAGAPPEHWARVGDGLVLRQATAAASAGLLLPHPLSGLLLVQPDASPARTLRATLGAPFAPVPTTREPPHGHDFGVRGLDGTGTLLSDGATTWRFRAGDWAELHPAHPLDPSRQPRGLAIDPADGALLLAGDDGGTFRWTGLDFEPIDAWPAAPLDALPAADGARVFAFTATPAGLAVSEWAGGGWVPRTTGPAPVIPAPAIAALPEGGLALGGDPASADVHRFTAPPARLPHLLATFPLAAGPAPRSLRLSARVGGTGTGPDGQPCHGALLALVDPAGGRALRLATTDAPADAPAALSVTLAGPQLDAFSAATALELVVSPRCAADALDARVSLEAPEVVASSGP